MVESSFWLRGAGQSIDGAAEKKLAEMKKKQDALLNELTTIKKRLNHQGDHGGWRTPGQDYGAWKGDKSKGKGKGAKGGKGPYDPPAKQFLDTHPQSGKTFCRRFNMGKEHNKDECQHLHQCNWFHCKDRKNCPGAHKCKQRYP